MLMQCREQRRSAPIMDSMHSLAETCFLWWQLRNWIRFIMSFAPTPSSPAVGGGEGSASGTISGTALCNAGPATRSKDDAPLH